MAGPLAGVRVVELAGVGPAPFAGMVLADLGASVVRVDRPDAPASAAASSAPSAADRPADHPEMMNRGKRSIAVDLKRPGGAEVVRKLAAVADILLEGFRPGVAERLGVGPEQCREINPRLVYGRVTGWGRSGPLSGAAGHDINYIALAGALAHMGRAGSPPTPPLNLVGDFGGGGMLLVVGVLAALLETRRSGKGQVVDAAMTDGAALLMTMTHDWAARGMWSDRRGSNLLDTGAPFYDVYETADGEYMAVGALEPQFRAELLERLQVDVSDLGDLRDPAAWPQLRSRLAEAFAARTRWEWTGIFAGSDACVTPVLTMSEARAHPHNRARSLFAEVGGRPQPAPAPRFSRTPPPPPAPGPLPGADAGPILAEAGFTPGEIGRLREAGVIR